MSFVYIPRPELEHDLEDICEGLSTAAGAVLTSTAKAIIVRLVAGAVQGEPLGGNLHDCRKFKFDLPQAHRHLHPATAEDPSPRWRIVYRTVDAQLRGGAVESRLDVLAVGRRGELAAYRVAAKRLRRGR